MPRASPDLLETVREENRLTLIIRGDWEVREVPPGFSDIASQFSNGSSPAKVTFEAGELRSYDSSLISLLLQLQRRCEENQISVDRASLPDGINQLLEMALAVPEKRDARDGSSERAFFYRVGQASIKLVDEVLELFAFLGECILSLGRLLTGRARFRRNDLWVTLQETGVEALPIVSLISGLIGMILAFVGAYQMAGIGATVYVASLVAIAMVREMGCLMTGIIMSGRTGAAFAAQLGSMKVNEEIDALKTFGFSAIDFLVLPRMLALILMMPLLTIYSMVIGIAGGALVTCLGFDVGLAAYLDMTKESLSLKAIALGTSKSVVFGIVVAGAGCLRGMQSGSSASAVGTAATSAVVVSITAIIVTDCVFAVVTTMLGI